MPTNYSWGRSHEVIWLISNEESVELRSKISQYSEGEKVWVLYSVCCIKADNGISYTHSNPSDFIY